MKAENEYLREKIKTNEDQFNRQIADKDAVIMILEKERGELLNYKEASECQFVAYEQKLRNRDNIFNNSNELDESFSNETNQKKRRINGEHIQKQMN